MSKNIAFFADGTWDEPSVTAGKDSNVCLLNQAALNDNITQVTHYDTGVGTDGNAITNLEGGAMGAGLFQKIKDGYSFLASVYSPGDQLFLNGFSRGAYTARSLAGMVACCGLPSEGPVTGAQLTQLTDTAFEAYRNYAQRATLLAALADQFHTGPAIIRFVGVWDTVGSLGIPAIFGGIDTSQYGFLDTGLHPSIAYAVQALAIDERRLQFQPALWTSAPTAGQFLEQVWFAGVHCDVGGGYPPANGTNRLSNITLWWMATHAQKAGLLFAPGSFPATPTDADTLAAINNSLTGLYRLTPHQRNIVTSSTLSSSVRQKVETPADSYAPSNLHITAGVLDPAYSVIAL